MGVDVGEDWNYPGSFSLPNLLTVGAWNPFTESSASFSNYSDSLVQLYAPGVAVQPRSDFDSRNGTSQAAAYVTGIAACLLAENPSWRFQELIAQLQELSEPKDNLISRSVWSNLLVSCSQNTVSNTSTREHEISIFPNPAFNKLYLLSNLSNAQSIRIQIYDMSGRLQADYDSINPESIDVSNLASGMYLLTVFNEDIRITEKFIKR